jgi:hypothetical protein
MVDGTCPKKSVPTSERILPDPLTEQEKQLVSILEIVQVERYVYPGHRYPGRKPFDLQALARAFVAKALHRHPMTSDPHCALQPAANLRWDMWIWNCRFLAAGDHLFAGLYHICRWQSGQCGA